MPTPAEIVALINELPDDDRPQMITLLQNDLGDVIKTARGKIASGAKRDGASKVPQLERERDEALQKVADLELANQELSSKAPDLATKEREWKDKLAAKEREFAEKLTAKEQALTRTRRDVMKEKFVERLVEKGVSPKYARRVAAEEHADRFTFGEDGTPDVLKPGEDSGYDAADVDQKIALLAADVVGTIDAEFIRTNVDSGGGRTNGGNGGGYDPVKAGREMAEAQKAKTSSNLAFR